MALPSLVLGQAANWPCSVLRLQPATCNLQPTLPVHLLDGPAADLQELGQFPWLTSFDRSSRMYSRCCWVRLGRRPGKRPSAHAFAWPATERSLIEFRHHSLKANTTASCSLPVDVDVSKSSDRDRNFPPTRCRPSITCSPQVSAVNGGDEVDRVGGRSLTFGG